MPMSHFAHRCLRAGLVGRPRARQRLIPARAKSHLPRWRHPWSCSWCVPHRLPRPGRAPRQHPRHAVSRGRGPGRSEAACRAAGHPDLDAAAAHLRPGRQPRRPHRGRHQQAGQTPPPACSAPAAPAAAAPAAARQGVAGAADAHGGRRRRVAATAPPQRTRHAGARRRRPAHGPPAAPALSHPGRDADAGDRAARAPPQAAAFRR